MMLRRDHSFSCSGGRTLVFIHTVFQKRGHDHVFSIHSSCCTYEYRLRTLHTIYTENSTTPARAQNIAQSCCPDRIYTHELFQQLKRLYSHEHFRISHKKRILTVPATLPHVPAPESTFAQRKHYFGHLFAEFNS